MLQLMPLRSAGRSRRPPHPLQARLQMESLIVSGNFTINVAASPSKPAPKTEPEQAKAAAVLVARLPQSAISFFIDSHCVQRAFQRCMW